MQRSGIDPVSDPAIERIGELLDLDRSQRLVATATAKEQA